MAEGHAERRLITAMFIDIVGSTELVALGPERMKRILDRCFSEMAAEVTAEGGTVEKYIGDAIFVIFGAPVAHEDDALRALRAAGRCLVKAAAEIEGRPPIPIRIGLETGDALVDLDATKTDRQRMAVGACVNIASRLQAIAAPGTALLGPGVREAAGDGAALEAVGDVELKGLGRSPAWRLIAATSHRVRPRMAYVGRDAELEVLELAFRRAAAGRSVLAVVSGPPGQGKTRIVEELLTRIGDGVTLLAAGCRPAGELGPLEPLRQLIDESSADGVRARVDRVIADPAEAERVADALAHSAGLRASDALRSMPVPDRTDEITNAWRRYLASLARDRPVIVWIEDVHWADPQLVALIDRLTLSGTAPLLFVATARPEFAQQSGLRPTGQRFFVDLEPLGPADSLRLAALAGGANDPITGRAEGNPLYIIELSRARAGRDDALPMTLRGVIGARLDDLPDQQRRLLQAASIVGERFTAADVALLVAADLGEVHASLDQLVDLVYLRAGGDGAYRFHHGLMRDVAYGQFPIADRLRLHARYARGGIDPEDNDRIAHHLWEAVGGPDAAWVWEDAAERAALRREARAVLLASARANGEAFLLDVAIQQGRRVLELADGPPDRAAAHQVIGEAYLAAVAGDEALEHLNAALAAYREAGLTPSAQIHAAIADVIGRPGGLRRAPDPAQIDALLAEGVELARAQEDVLSEARILTVVAIRSVDPKRSDELFGEIDRLIERTGDRPEFAQILAVQSSHELFAGRPDRSRDVMERARALAVRTGARTDVLFFQLANVAFVLGDLPGLEASTTDYERAVASAGPHNRQHPRRGRALLALAHGDWPGGRRIARLVATDMDAHPETVFCVGAGMAISHGATAAAVSGELVEARELLERAKKIAALPNVGEAFLAAAYAALGMRGDVQRVDEAVEPDALSQWLPIALVQLGEWTRVERRLPGLERRGAGGDAFSGAIAAAVREALAARDGGPRPAHARLRGIGYVGISELLFFRPNVD